MGKDKKKKDAKSAPASQQKKRGKPKTAAAERKAKAAAGTSKAAGRGHFSNVDATPQRTEGPPVKLDDGFDPSLGAVRFMDSPFVEFCNGMLSPITPSSAKGKAFSNLGSLAAGRSPGMSGTWTPDLMALFNNGKNPVGDFLAGFDGSFGQGPVPSGIPVTATAGEKGPALFAGVDEVEEKKAVVAKKKKRPSKGAKEGKLSTGAKTAVGGQSNSNNTTKLSPPNTTPKQPKNPSRMLDFGGEALLEGEAPATKVVSPVTPGTVANGNQATGSKSSNNSSKRRRSTCAGERCNCKKSKCLKLYCGCFAGGRFCNGDCLCKDCGNREWNKKQVRKRHEEEELFCCVFTRSCSPL